MARIFKHISTNDISKELDGKRIDKGDERGKNLSVVC